MNVTEFSESIQNPENGIVTIGTTHLDTVTFPVLVIESAFSLRTLGWHLLSLTRLNRYLSRGSNRNFIFTTSSENIFLLIFNQI